MEQLSFLPQSDNTPILKSTVLIDDFTKEITKCFDYDFDGNSYFKTLKVPYGDLPKKYNIGLIVGSSGSGKSTLLKSFGTEEEITWDNSKCIASNFNNPQEAINRLTAVGLNSVPTWTKPYCVLSNGEKFRADLARRIKHGAVIDEFTSVIDRSVAKACSVSVSKFIKNNNIENIVFASCHRDIIEWLEPDWIFDTDIERIVDRRFLRRPEIKLDIHETDYNAWEVFKNHHYLSNEMNKACRCFVALWDDVPVAFSSNLSLPGKIPPLFKGDNRKKFRESRLVVLPDYQGMGIGTRFSNAIGEIFLNKGYRYFSKTAHIRMGEYRNRSDLWRKTSTNLKSREKSQKQSKNEVWHHLTLDTKRLCYSHEYIGKKTNKFRIAYEQGFMEQEILELLNAQLRLDI